MNWYEAFQMFHMGLYPVNLLCSYRRGLKKIMHYENAKNAVKAYQKRIQSIGGAGGQRTIIEHHFIGFAEAATHFSGDVENQ